VHLLDGDIGEPLIVSAALADGTDALVSLVVPLNNRRPDDDGRVERSLGRSNPGYLPDPGHKGTGKLVAIVCKT
jgi:hypothetical protein